MIKSNSDEDRYCERMNFPNTFNEFAEQYGFTDEEEHYTNGSQLIPVFRVKQWLNHIPNNSDEDCISRADAIANIRILYPDMPVVDIMGARHKWSEKYQQYRDCEKILADLPSVQPKPKTGHWISKHIVDDCNGVVTWYECSECGRSIDAPITEEFMLKDYPYCHCGAKMIPTDSESGG